MIQADAKTHKDIELAQTILRRFGCRGVYMFGSLVEDDFTDHSDIDCSYYSDTFA